MGFTRKPCWLWSHEGLLGLSGCRLCCGAWNVCFSVALSLQSIIPHFFLISVKAISVNTFGQSALDWRVLKSCNISEGCIQAAMTNYKDGKKIYSIFNYEYHIYCILLVLYELYDWIYRILHGKWLIPDHYSFFYNFLTLTRFIKNELKCYYVSSQLILHQNQINTKDLKNLGNSINE